VVSPSPSYCCITGVSAINRLVAFYDVYEGKREVLFFYFVPDTTRGILLINNTYIHTLTLDPRRGNRGILDIPPRRPRFTKITMRNTANVTGDRLIAVYIR
jgi:hypothetical protein